MWKDGYMAHISCRNNGELSPDSKGDKLREPLVLGVAAVTLAVSGILGYSLGRSHDVPPAPSVENTDGGTSKESNDSSRVEEITLTLPDTEGRREAKVFLKDPNIVQSARDVAGRVLTAAGKSVDSNAARLVRQDYYDDHNRPKQQSITITDDKGHVVSVDVAQGDKRFGGSEIAVEVTTDIIEVGAKSRQTDRITWRLDFLSPEPVAHQHIESPEALLPALEGVLPTKVEWSHRQTADGWSETKEITIVSPKSVSPSRPDYESIAAVPAKGEINGRAVESAKVYDAAKSLFDRLATDGDISDILPSQ